MTEENQPHMTPERWNEKFTSSPGDETLTPAPAGVEDVLAELRAGTISCADATARLEKLDFSPLEAKLAVQYALEGNSHSGE